MLGCPILGARLSLLIAPLRRGFLFAGGTLGLLVPLAARSRAYQPAKTLGAAAAATAKEGARNDRPCGIQGNSRSREGHHGDYMVRNGTPVASVEIDTKDASAIAGVVLSAAKSAYDEGQWKTPPLSRTLAAQLRRLALIEAYVRALEATDFAARLENLERANNR
jgi:hypothetical protein